MNYPPYLRYKQRFIEPRFNLDKNKYMGTFINRNNKYWSIIYKKIDLLYKYNSILPKGTIIYRCSINKNPNKLNNKNKSLLIYFGLDFVISLWIALEINDINEKYIPCYLHIYELTEDIPYKYIYDNGI